MAQGKLEKKLLDAAQAGLPAVPRPFAALGRTIGATEEQVIAGLAALKKKGVIRRLGGSFETRKLGFSSTLAGARVKPSKLAAVAAVISKHPGVTHCYERAGELNLWFTLGVRGPMAAVGRALAPWRRLPGVERLHSFPVKRMFKIRTFFKS
jgi:siroheme decarboxylase